MPPSSQIQDNLKKLHEQMAHALSKAGRASQEVKLIAISKTFPADQVQAAFEAGQLCFGENRIQEALEKIPALPASLEWHLVGHLQKNKARFCPGNFQWIHSLDSQELVERLEKRCAQEQQQINGLIQVNLSGESSKQGIWEWDDLCRLTESMLACQWVKLKGLMTLAEANVGEKKTRATFEKLRQWKTCLVEQFGNEECTELSMGMSSDYPWAIAEGATFIRIGSAIFGQRG